MVLSTHAVVGAALATFFPTHPEVAFLAGFTSHFLLDSIPHWDYHLESSHDDPFDKMKNTLVFTRDTLFDFVKIGVDILLGILIAYVLFGSRAVGYEQVSIFAGALGGVTPDGIQFLYYQYGGRFITPLQRFHQWIHARTDINNRPVLGICSQVVVAGLLTVIVYNI